MPFNDYWSTPPALTNFDFKPWLIGGGVAVLAFIVGLFAGKGWLILLGLLAIVLVVAGVLFAIVDKGRKPFPISAPPAPGPDLPTVLKALTLQRDFTAFAIETQGQDDQALHAAFGDFLARTRPNDLETATQKPGIIGV
jgi:hypothetical protein